MSVLYMIASPIGNLSDITLRALETLKKVDVVACEDTRRGGKLLAHYNIKKRLISCRAANEVNSARGIIKLMEEGQDVAYLSDAGSPGTSDPGSRLCKEVMEAGFSVLPLPGPSSPSCLLSVSPISGNSYFFQGFLPQKGQKRLKRLAWLRDLAENFIVLESPYRIVKLLQEMTDICPDRTVFIGREMTKLHEEYLMGSPRELLFAFKTEKKAKGEFIILASGRKID